MEFARIDHFVLTVDDIETTCEFYSERLGAEVVTYDSNRKALQFGDQKINIHQVGDEFEPNAAQPQPGSGDFCVTTELPIEEVKNSLSERGVEIIDGPVERTGARGTMMSVYIRDPDDNLIEIAEYAGGTDE